jgi:tyrosinase
VLLRRNIWTLGTTAAPWHPATLAYALAVREMQARPAHDPTSWTYQAAIHGTLATAAASPRTPSNQCQHATWYFLPWHRMYLHRFEQIVREIAAALPTPVADWTVPYWDYSSGAPGNALPPAFRAANLPDGSANPLFVRERRPSVNAGHPLPAAVTDTSAAMAERVFSASLVGPTTGFGGPRTGWTHQGPAFGTLEAQPHGPIHVWVGAGSGLMADPATAALDPIFWLHHSNIDRLWAAWNAGGGANATASAWLKRSFRLPAPTGKIATMRVSATLSTEALGYDYDPAPGGPALAGALPAMPQPGPPSLVGANDAAVMLTGGPQSVTFGIREPPEARGIAPGAGPSRRTYLNVSGIVADENPGLVYGVYLNLPPGSVPDDAHLAGIVSFFGVAQSPSAAGRATGPDRHDMRYAFDITDLVGRLRDAGEWGGQVHVTFAPIESGHDADAGLAAEAARRPVRIGTVSVHVA